LKVPDIERWKPVKYRELQYRWRKENDIEMPEIVGHVAASDFLHYEFFLILSLIFWAISALVKKLGLTKGVFVIEVNIIDLYQIKQKNK
jgi:hypothetical protein